jgi:NADPH:quinone reductase-like Zn-dependent oxidoreductase
MRVAQVSAAGTLALVAAPIPEPRPGEAQLRILAATLNYRDILLMKRGNPDGRLPYVPLSCACAEVTKVGEGVTRIAVGDRVMPTFFQNWLSGPPPEKLGGLGGPVDGVARDYACFPADTLVRVPPSMGDLEAATLPCAGLTAWSALFELRATRPGDVVLLMGTGGVSIAGLQLAKSIGATVIITSSSDAKVERARALGADLTINYRATPDWGEKARELTGGRGVDVVLEVGGAETLPQSSRAVRDGGDIAAIGLLTGSTVRAVPSSARLVRVRVGSRDGLEALVKGVVAARIRPVVDRVYPLEALGDALECMRSGRFFGKIAVQMA